MGRRKKLTLAALGAVVVLLIGVTAYGLINNRMAFEEERVTIQGPRGELHGVLAVPSGSNGPFGLVVFVHGDGPANASNGDQYKPLWDAFAKSGFAALSWDKPGVSGAPGDWLHQSMRDRVAEVDAALAWAHDRDDIDTTRIGAWGIDQAGLVLPEVARARPDLRFLIMVGPTVDWLSQTDFALRARLAADDASPARVAEETGRRARRVELMQSGADYRTYRASSIDPTPMSADRWNFDRRNFTSDATADLRHVAIPTLLIVGGRDRVVDVAATERAYRDALPPNTLTVKQFPDGSHSMMRGDIEYGGSGLESAGRRILAPKSVYVPDYLDALRVFAKRQSE